MTYTYCCVYNARILMMDGETVRNMQSFIPKINLRNWCILLVLLYEYITMQGLLNVKINQIPYEQGTTQATATS